MRNLFSFLDKLIGFYPYRDDDDDPNFTPDFIGWKEWVVRYTPTDKRGGLDGRKVQKRNDGNMAKENK